jgi:hypothetical protein
MSVVNGVLSVTDILSVPDVSNFVDIPSVDSITTEACILAVFSNGVSAVADVPDVDYK